MNIGGYKDDAKLKLGYFNEHNQIIILEDPIHEKSSANIIQSQAKAFEQAKRMGINMGNQSVERTFKERNPRTYSANPVYVSPGESLLRPMMPPPVISPQFKIKKPRKSVHGIRAGESLLQKAVETECKPNFLQSTATPSGTISTTDNHANRSLVYRKPVSTKDTAPCENSTEIEYLLDTIDTNSSHTDDDDILEPTVLTDNVLVSDTNLSGSSFSIGELTIEPVLYVPECDSSLTKDSGIGTSIQLSRSEKQRLRHQHKILNEQSAAQYTQIKKTLQQYTSEWDKSKSRPIDTQNPHKMTEILTKCPVQKRSRAKSAYVGDMEDEIRSYSLHRVKSNDSLEIINLDGMPERLEQKINRSVGGHDSLYNMIKLDAKKAIDQRTSEVKRDAKQIIFPSGKSIQISNGQLSDATGPIRLLDKSAIRMPGVMEIHRQNAAIASLPPKDKARMLKGSIEECASELHRLQKDDEKQNRRTYSRSKSFSAKPKMHFKLSSLTNPISKAKKQSVQRLINHESDWQSFTNVLSSNISKSEASSSGKVTPNEPVHNGIQSRSNSPSIGQMLSWNTNRTLGQLPSTQCVFQHNEFGFTEMDVLAMAKLRAMKSHKNDYKNFPQVEPSMACGHSDSATCFDAHVQRMNSGNPNNICKVNGKKPHQIHSTEYKEVFGALVQKKNNNCQTITTADINEALNEKFMYERTKNSFTWSSRIIDHYNATHPNDEQIQVAPAELFVNSIPKTPNTFEIGQKLEAIDPQNSSLFCVCTIIDKCGYRIKLHFDGYNSIYDFWVNADSLNIFPAGWCFRTGRELEVNRRLVNNRAFDWQDYLRETNTQAAHRACFSKLSTPNTQKTQINPFKIDMKLEADDIKNTNRICVASIGDVIDSRILVKLDGFESCYDYWTDIRSPIIHPINFHVENGYSIINPPDWQITPFCWESYLRRHRAEAVPKSAFHMRERKAFKVGMALEVVDKKNKSLIRPAVIKMIHDYSIKVLFIGWPEYYAFWIEDDSDEIFPPGYCKKTGHPMELPLMDCFEIPRGSCGIVGCRGIGNAKRPEKISHMSLDECPYERDNWVIDDSASRPNRIDRKHKVINSAFNTGAGPSRKVSVNPAFEKVQVSLQPTLNPAELAAMSSKDVEIFRRLQVSANFLLENRKELSAFRQQWIDRLKPLRSIEISAAAKNPLNWSTTEVAEFVSKLPNCSMLGKDFIENDIDGLAFLSLRKNDMIDIMGLSIGSAIKVFDRIVLLREECNAHYIRYE